MIIRIRKFSCDATSIVFQDNVLLVQFISTHNVWLQQIGTDLTQSGSTTPSIISVYFYLSVTAL